LKNFTHPKPEISSNQTSLIRLRYFFFCFKNHKARIYAGSKIMVEDSWKCCWRLLCGWGQSWWTVGGRYIRKSRGWLVFYHEKGRWGEGQYIISYDLLLLVTIILRKGLEHLTMLIIIKLYLFLKTTFTNIKNCIFFFFLLLLSKFDLIINKKTWNNDIKKSCN
jgi:hypothetical protein